MGVSVGVSCLFVPFGGQSQAFSDLQLVAAWPLVADASDSLGQQAELELINVEGPGQEGIYLNGNYIYGDPDSSLAATPPIDWDFDHLAVSLEIKLVDTSNYRPVFVFGDLYRWLGVYLQDDKLGLLVNDYSSAVLSDKVLDPGKWYRVALRWDTGTARLYVDGQEVAMATADSLIHLDSPSDRRVSNTHFGLGQAFKGHWRRLYAWSGLVSTATRARIDAGVEFACRPNPATDFLELQVPHGHWTFELYDLSGRAMATYQLRNGGWARWMLDRQGLPPGVYFLRAHDEQGKVAGGCKLVLE